jgi:hypothetical protein
LNRRAKLLDFSGGVADNSDRAGPDVQPHGTFTYLMNLGRTPFLYQLAEPTILTFDAPTNNAAILGPAGQRLGLPFV